MPRTAAMQTGIHPADAAVSAAALLDRIDLQRLDVSARIAADQGRRARFGQFFTPEPIAQFMASLFAFPRMPETLRVLDAGGGNGMLTAAFVAELCSEKRPHPQAIIATVWELDEELIPSLEDSLRLCQSVCERSGVRFEADIRQGDFILEAADMLGGNQLFTGNAPRFDAAILNPPYRKLRTDSIERARLSSAGIETSNLYAAFVWLAMELLTDQGEMVAITPRSYMNGSYFRPFRRALLDSMRFRRVHVYDTRDTAFNGDDVLQENAIIHAVKGEEAAPIVVSTSHGPHDEGMASRTLDAAEFVLPDDRDSVMHVVSDDTEAQIGEKMRGLPRVLSELDIEVSTGRVVDFRARDRLREKAANGDVPLVFPRHCMDGFVTWPRDVRGKPNAIHVRGEDDPDILPAGWYVLVKRFSSKEEKRRIVASLCDPGRLPKSGIGFDNKLNIFHRHGRGLPPALAKGLALFLNSTVVDAYFRQFSGHTQVNARDLRSLHYPDRDTLERLGRHVNGRMPTTEEINRIVNEEIPTMSAGDDPIAVKTKVEAAVGALKALKAPKGQCNERSALTLLALLDLEPKAKWSRAADPRRGVTEMMDWMAEKYGKKYAPNTRETIRRFTLHQFVQMGLVLLNSDDPSRPTNSPKNVYQIEPSALALLRTFGTDDWQKNLKEYLDSIQGKNRLREAARKMAQIPVTLPDGKTFQLTAGGQNVLIKEIIEQFAPRYTPGGHVIYVGDAGEKHLLNDEKYLAKLGVVTERHGKMPDVVIHYKDRNWLVLIEAVTSHGPVNKLRHTQLKDLFKESKAGLVFVTAFLDRQAMREYLPDIAWETEVWVADAPSHLIHFNGERFLGPYES
ncbi:MAG: Eco57I restriction-modification methylase domain-containing protein [Planctomycetes bacterium]|nr:Eco57I restriction-modification methylase domain-containing protein [Planctomycetota bacterium]